MSPTSTRKRATRPKKKTRKAWLPWLPLILAVVGTPFAVRAASVFALSGPTALRMLYPFVVMVQVYAQHLSADQADTISQWLMYGQFPVYGLIWILARHLMGATAGPLSVVLLHMAGVAAAVLLVGH